MDHAARWTLALCLLGLAQAAAADWPQWRGPDGQGIAGETELPTNWGSESPNVRWMSFVPGEGISSPIVVDGRVYLTTSFEGMEQSEFRSFMVAGHLVMAVLLITFTCVVPYRRGDRIGLLTRGSDQPTGSRRSWIVTLDAVIVVLSTIGFLVVGTGAAIWPERFSITPGDFGPNWLISGGVALVGLGAAVGWLSRGSWLRLVGSVALIAAAGAVFWLAPLGRYGTTMPAWQRAVVASPGVVLGAWYLMVLAMFRGTSGGKSRVPLLAALLLAVHAGLFFAGANYWQPRVGRIRAVHCYDLDDGRHLWIAPVFLAPEERKYKTNSHATPTPCCDGEHIFADFGSGWACLDISGRLLWSRVDEEYQHQTKYGAGSSPLMTDELFIVVRPSESLGSGENRHRTGPGWILALDKQTGNERWRITKDELRDSFSTPILVGDSGTERLIVPTWERILAFDAANGKILWTRETPIQLIVPSAVTNGERLVITGGAEGGPKWTIAYRLVDDSTPPEKLWQYRRNVPKTASPVLYRNLLFVLDDGGILTCLDPATGKKHWNKRIGGNYFTSLVAGDRKVFAANEAGTVSVIAAEPRYKLLAKNEIGPIGAGTYASPALADGCFILRTGSHLICIAEPTLGE